MVGILFPPLHARNHGEFSVCSHDRPPPSAPSVADAADAAAAAAY